MILSPYQRDIIDAVVSRESNLLVQAVAGSGKTTTLLEALAAHLQAWPRAAVLNLAFNRDICDVLRQKCGRRFGALRTLDIKTLHGHGMSIVRRHWGGCQLDSKKAFQHAEQLLAASTFPRPIYDDAGVCVRVEEVPHHVSALKEGKDLLVKLGSLVMQLLCDPEKPASIVRGMHRIGMVADEDLLQEILPLVPAYMNALNQDSARLCYDEMIYLPLRYGWQGYRYDLILVDEAQDLNESQQALIASARAANAVVVAVGDRRQSIYQFRGADPGSMDHLRERFAMRELSLPITYRCPRAVVSLVHMVVPGAAHLKARDDADDGVVDEVSPADVVSLLREAGPDTLVLCRTNAPLIKPALGLLRKGIKATIRGRDIGGALLRLAEKFARRAPSIEAFSTRINQWVAREEEKAGDNLAALEHIRDQAAVLRAMADEFDSVQEVLTRLAHLFSDEAAGLVFSSVHRSKGLEAEHVILLAPDLIPHPLHKRAADPATALTQEHNLLYVALTRSKCRLTLEKHKKHHE
jgi:superfamily I DNA/RNA helicase